MSSGDYNDQYLDDVVDRLLNKESVDYSELLNAVGISVQQAINAVDDEYWYRLAIMTLVGRGVAIGDIMQAMTDLAKYREGSQGPASPDPSSVLNALPLPQAPDPTSQPPATAVPAPPKGGKARAQRPAAPRVRRG